MHVYHTASRARQRGLSFIGVIFIGLIAVAAFAIGGQSIPIFLEYQAIQKAATKAAREGATVPDIRAKLLWQALLTLSTVLKSRPNRCHPLLLRCSHGCSICSLTPRCCSAP